MTKKQTNLGFSAVALLFLLLVVGVISAIGWRVVLNRNTTINQSNGQSINYFGNKIPLVNCEKAKSLLNGDPYGDICYVGKISLNGEDVTYISVRQSEDYRSKLESNCTLDCGGAIYPESQDNIIRANGKVEYASDGWGEAEPDIDYLTGCGTGKFFELDSLKNQGKLIKYNDRIAIDVSFKNGLITDDYGNRCTIDAKLIKYTSREGASIDIQHVGVHYELKDISTCEQETKSEFCYTAQATMRNDLKLCDMAIDKEYPSNGSDYCIESMAKRRLDPSLCGRLNDSSDICYKDTKLLKENFSGKLTVY